MTQLALGLGKSLWPFIRTQSILQFAAVEPADLKLGDLVVYCGKKQSVCHRVLLKRQDPDGWWFFLKGDGNLHSDGWIPESRILGRVTHVDGRPVRTGFGFVFALGHFLYSRLWLKWKGLKAISA